MKRLQTRRLVRLFPLLLWLVFAGLALLIVWNSLGYLTHPRQMALVAAHESGGSVWWRFTVVLHVAAGIACLLASFLQFFRSVLRRFPWLHRWLGRIYSACTLWLVCPTGVVLAFTAHGGPASTAGFLLLGALTFWSTLAGTRAMTGGNVQRHAVWMIRSFAMTSTAVTFRLWHVGLQELGLEFTASYITSLWLSLAGNAGAAEFVIRRLPIRRLSTHKQHTHEIPDHRPLLHARRGSQFSAQ